MMLMDFSPGTEALLFLSKSKFFVGENVYVHPFSLHRDKFIEGILCNKFSSTVIEMTAVVNKFDHGDGMVDWHEFIAALKPDWKDFAPQTEYERIEDEIERQVAQCTCRQKFKVFQVGEGKYRVSSLSAYISYMYNPSLCSK